MQGMLGAPWSIGEGRYEPLLQSKRGRQAHPAIELHAADARPNLQEGWL